MENTLERLGRLPDAAAWRRFGDLALLAAGVLLALAGIVFFFAYNWEALHRFAKIALVGAPLTACAALAARYAEQRAGQAWLGGPVVLAGVLLAVIGQIYQTGADSELLFAGWALLALPWVLAGRVPWLWLFWLLLLNVAVNLFVFGRVDFPVIPSGLDPLLWTPLLLNAAALALTWQAPAAGMGGVALALGFARARVWLMWLGGAAQVWGIGHFYHDLQSSLLVKSGLMLLGGALLLAVRALLTREQTR
ncbi:MAG: DUF2157 domain-containing protein [Desulfobulbus sp.]|nr:DUF2157 domain-containing protein [Desulfobulbus sp.]